MHILGASKFDEDPIKNEGAIGYTTFSPLQVYGQIFFMFKGKTSSPIWSDINLFQDFVPVQNTCNFVEDPITNEGVAGVVKDPNL